MRSWRDAVLVALGALAASGGAACGPDRNGLDGASGQPYGGTIQPNGPLTAAQRAQQMFVNDVYPALQPSCASCHATGAGAAPIFLGNDAATSYAAIEASGLVADPATSQLVLHGKHTGPALTSSQQGTVVAWLSQEMLARTSGGGAGGLTSADLTAALASFGACMSYADWTQAGLDALGTMKTQNAGTCSGCHNVGDGNFYANTDGARTFTASTKGPYVETYVMGSVDAKGGFAGLVAANVITDKAKSAAACTQGAGCHPQFTVDPALQAGIYTFVSTTLARFKINACSKVTRPDGG
jgi:hypothetical protein